MNNQTHIAPWLPAVTTTKRICAGWRASTSAPSRECHSGKCDESMCGSYEGCSK